MNTCKSEHEQPMTYPTDHLNYFGMKVVSCFCRWLSFLFVSRRQSTYSWNVNAIYIHDKLHTL